MARCENGDAAPTLIDRAWSRQDVSGFLEDLAARGCRTLIGLDLSPSFPFMDEGAFFPGWTRSPSDAKALWALVETLAVDDPNLAATSVVQHPELRRHFRQQGDRGDLFPAGRGRFRLCEHGQAALQLSPYSCFNLVGASQVGKSSLTGMRMFHRLRGKIGVWPFDPAPSAGPLMVEIYTALAAREAGMRKGISKIRDPETLDSMLNALGSAPHLPLSRYDDHATDAILTAAWLRKASKNATLWVPKALTPQVAQTEGWTFGVY